jgi:hypothetical protein
MRVFAKPGGIERLSLEARVVYTFFCLFLLIGYASSVWFWLDDELGLGAKGPERYYLGEESAPAKEEAGGGPDLDLPAEGASTLRLEKPPRQVMETFHFHLFSVSVCLLIVAHLFMMTGLSTRWKAIVIGLSSASTLLHLLVPVLIRFGSRGWSGLMFPSVAIMSAGWIYMTAQPMVEMWTKIPRRPEEIADG